MEKFGCAITCIDGRAHLPVIDWVKSNASVDYVDLITAPGLDGVLINNKKDIIDRIYEDLRVSFKVHHPSIIAVVGHFDCRGNPVTPEEHQEHILAGTVEVAKWVTGTRVAGIYVNEMGRVQVVSDTVLDNQTMRSYL